MLVAINSFVRRQTANSPYSHFEGTEMELLDLVNGCYVDGRTKDGYRDGVILVQVPPKGFYTGLVKLESGDELVGKFEPRCAGEEPRKSVHVRRDNGKRPAAAVDIVLYRHDVLIEDGDAETTAEWEIISINAYPTEEEAPIPPNVLMHNHFGSDGGTSTLMDDEKFVEKLRESFEYWKDKAILEAR